MFLAPFLGVAIGLSLGLTGAGGGILAVPALMFGLNLTLAQAAPIALIAVAGAAAIGAIQGLRRGLVRYKAAMLMAVAGALTAPIGIWLAQRLWPSWLNIGFAAVMIIVAARMWHQARCAPASSSESMPDAPARVCRISAETGRFVWTPRTGCTLAAIGAISGVCTGMLGVGGGFIIVPALAYFSDARMHSIVSTSLMVIALVSTAAVGAAAAHGLEVTWIETTFIAGAIVGMLMGRAVAPKVPTRILQHSFAVVCVVVAGMLLWRTFQN